MSKADDLRALWTSDDMVEDSLALTVLEIAPTSENNNAAMSVWQKICLNIPFLLLKDSRLVTWVFFLD
jgi:hypothetical protein